MDKMESGGREEGRKEVEEWEGGREGEGGVKGGETREN